jgi:phosphoesterase RecJ-like protein
VNGSLADVVRALRDGRTFVLTSHARPDGDAVGSTVALALALESLGKTVTMVLRDPVPAPYLTFPDVMRITTAERVDAPAEIAVLLECSDRDRPGLVGLDRYPLVNVDHHLGNRMYGVANWFDPTAAACGEQVADIIDALGVTWTPAIAKHLYLAIATDTGSFRYGAMSKRTFDTVGRIAALGISTADLSRAIFDSFTIGRVKLTGAILNAMELHAGGRLALLRFDDALLDRCGAHTDDTEGLVNLPLAAREVVAVALFKQQDERTVRLSFRSKGAVDVRRVASRWQGGGHVNAAGCTVVGTIAEIHDAVVAEMTTAIDAAAPLA